MRYVPNANCPNYRLVSREIRKTLNALLKERRMELAFEGQRWFDLVRLDKVESVMNAVYSKDSGRRARQEAFTENSYRLPIPLRVLQANSNMVQNKGY